MKIFEEATSEVLSILSLIKLFHFENPPEMVQHRKAFALIFPVLKYLTFLVNFRSHMETGIFKLYNFLLCSKE